MTLVFPRLKDNSLILSSMKVLQGIFVSLQPFLSVHNEQSTGTSIPARIISQIPVQ